MSLHPAFAQYLADLEPLIAAAVRDGVVATPESARQALAGLNAFAQPRVEVSVVEDRTVTADGVTIPVRLYVPNPDQANDAVLFVHGGGHMAGDLDVYDYQARRTAVASGMPVVSVDYRRSPEHLFPVGLEDTYRVLQAMPELLADVATTGVVHAVADSGGAAKLASIGMRAAAGTWTSPISRQVLLYPSLDYTMSGASIEEFGSGYFLSAERIRWYFDHYFPEGADRQAASPLSGPFTATMANTLVIAAEYDPLLSEATEYVERMHQAGAAAELRIAPGMIHAFAFFETLIPDEIDQLYAMVGEFLRSGVVSQAWRTPE